MGQLRASDRQGRQGDLSPFPSMPRTGVRRAKAGCRPWPRPPGGVWPVAAMGAVPRGGTRPPDIQALGLGMDGGART